MWRRLLTAVSVLSLLVAALSVCGWLGLVHTYITFDHVLQSPYPHGHHTLWIDCDGFWMHYKGWTWTEMPALVTTSYGGRFAWLAISRDTYFHQIELIDARIAHPPVIIVGSLLPFWSYLGWLRRRVTSETGPTCRACGYNLTGNTSGVCPECGTPTTAGVKA